MSILPINQLQLAVDMFSLPTVPVTDTGYEHLDGRDVQSILSNRTIVAAIDPSSMKQLEKIFGGDVADGDIVIYTRMELFILDETDALGPEGRKQSFVEYSGKQYRILNYADWEVQCGVRVYQGRLHVAQDII